MIAHFTTLSISILLSIRLSILSTHLPAIHGPLLPSLFTTLLPPILSLLHFLPIPSSLFLALLLLSSVTSRCALPLTHFILLLASTFTLPYRSNNYILLFTIFFLPSLLPQLPTHPLLSYISPLLHSLLFTVYFSNLPESPPSPPPSRKRRKRSRSLLSFLPPSLRLPNIFLFSYLLLFSPLPNLGRSIITHFHPRPLPSDYRLLAQQRGPTGLISVLDRKNRYRILTADYSVLGGRHICKNCIPDSIFSQFHLHEAVRLVGNVRQNESALSIGLGIGVVVQGMAQAGVDVTAIELDPLVVQYAHQYFGLSSTINVTVADGAQFLRDAQDNAYDYVIHDVFTGGVVPASLFSMQVWHEINRVLKPDGVVAVNFVGAFEHNTAAAGSTMLVFDRLNKVFSNVRLFSDEYSDSWTHNLVYFASPKQIGFRKPTKRETLGSELRQETLQSFEEREIYRKDIGPSIPDVEQSDWLLHMGQWNTSKFHVAIMREIHTKELWDAIYAREQLL